MHVYQPIARPFMPSRQALRKLGLLSRALPAASLGARGSAWHARSECVNYPAITAGLRWRLARPATSMAPLRPDHAEALLGPRYPSIVAQQRRDAVEQLT